jgi:hypothetical protein
MYIINKLQFYFQFVAQKSVFWIICFLLCSPFPPSPRTIKNTLHSDLCSHITTHFQTSSSLISWSSSNITIQFRIVPTTKRPMNLLTNMCICVNYAVITLYSNLHYANSLMLMLYANCSYCKFNRNYKILIFDHSKRHHHHYITTTLIDLFAISQTHIFILTNILHSKRFWSFAAACQRTPLFWDMILHYCIHCLKMLGSN